MLYLSQRPQLGDLVQVKMPVGEMTTHWVHSSVLDVCSNERAQQASADRFTTVSNAIWLRRISEDEHHSFVRELMTSHEDFGDELEEFFYDGGYDDEDWRLWSLVYINGRNLFVRDTISDSHDKIDSGVLDLSRIPDISEFLKPPDESLEYVIYGLAHLGISFGFMEGVISASSKKKSVKPSFTSPATTYE